VAPSMARQKIEELDGISRTWFEWSWEDGRWVRTLVVEVTQDTDPNVAHVPSMLDAIWDAFRGVQEKTTMTVTHLKVVPTL
jgi:hypothetical protein